MERTTIQNIGLLTAILLIGTAFWISPLLGSIIVTLWIITGIILTKKIQGEENK